MALRQETLATYRTRVLRELRDANQQIWNNQNSATPFADIDAWINEGIAFRDLWAKPSRRYAPNLPLTQGLDQYTLCGPAQGAAPTLFPLDTVLDVVNVWLLWGNWRGRLTELSFGEVTDGFRPWLQYQDIPAAYCRYGATQMFVASAPSGVMSVDVDVCVLSALLVLPGDPDPQPYPYTEPVVKYAAHLAYQNAQRLDEAAGFLEQANKWIRDIDASKVGMLPLPAVPTRR